MPIFTRSGRPVELDDPHQHEGVLVGRQADAAARVAKLTEQLAELQDEIRIAPLESRFDDATAAGEQVVSVRSELDAAQGAHEALAAAVQAVAIERQRLDHERRLAVVEGERDAALAAAADAAAQAIPHVLAARQALRESEAAHNVARNVHVEVHDLKMVLGLTAPNSRIPALPSAYQSVMDRHPIMFDIRNVSL